MADKKKLKAKSMKKVRGGLIPTPSGMTKLAGFDPGPVSGRRGTSTIASRLCGDPNKPPKH